MTRAFAIGLVFNVTANLLLIPRFGYMAAAYVAVASELALLIPFGLGVRRYLARIPWVHWVWKPALCTIPVLVLVTVLPDRLDMIGAVGGLALYVVGLILFNVFTGEEKVALGRVVPLGRLWGQLGRRLRALGATGGEQ